VLGFTLYSIFGSTCVSFGVRKIPFLSSELLYNTFIYIILYDKILPLEKVVKIEILAPHLEKVNLERFAPLF
jgi:hypothetical protein